MGHNDGGDETRRLYVWLARDPSGTSGIVQAVDTTDCAIPLVFTDRQTALSTLKHPALALLLDNCDAQLVVFDRAETITFATTGPPISGD